MKVKKSGKYQTLFSLIKKLISLYQLSTQSSASNSAKRNDQYSLMDMTRIRDRRVEFQAISKLSSLKTRTTNTRSLLIRNRIRNDMKGSPITRLRVISVRKKEKMLTKKISKCHFRSQGVVQICQAIEELNINRCKLWRQAMTCHLIIYLSQTNEMVTSQNPSVTS